MAIQDYDSFRIELQVKKLILSHFMIGRKQVKIVKYFLCLQL